MRVKLQGEEEVKDIIFFCPGCKTYHIIDTTWKYNYDPYRPTFSPSVWMKQSAKGPSSCHSFVYNGQIEFLHDCWHDLKGQTVPLPYITKQARDLHDGFVGGAKENVLEAARNAGVILDDDQLKQIVRNTVQDELVDTYISIMIENVCKQYPEVAEENVGI